MAVLTIEVVARGIYMKGTYEVYVVVHSQQEQCRGSCSEFWKGKKMLGDYKYLKGEILSL